MARSPARIEHEEPPCWAARRVQQQRHGNAMHAIALNHVQ